MLTAIINKHKKLVRFLITGGSAAAVEYIVFLLLALLLAALQSGTIIAQVLSFCTGLLVSFFLNKHWSFQSKGSAKQEFVRYFILAVINLIISTVFLWLLIEAVGLYAWVAKLIVMAMIAFWNFFLFQKFIFRAQPN